MKIIHCADLHLGSSLTSHFDLQRAKRRQDELFKTFIRMIEYASQNGVEAILISGDLFDHDHVSTTLKNQVYDLMRQYSSISFYYLKGNHDHHLDESNLPDNLYLFDHSWRSYLCHEAVITGVELDQDNINLVSNTLSLNPDDFNIVMMHGQITTSKQKNGEPIYLKELKNHHIDYLALGHIHSYSINTLDERGKYCYSGCLEGRGFDECGKHGFVLLDIQHHECKHTFIPFASRIIFSIEIDISQSTNQIEVLKCIQDDLNKLDHHQEDYIEITLTGNIPADCEIDLSWIKTQIEDEFSYIKLKNDTSILINYQDYLTNQSLKGEFIRNILDSDESEEQKMKMIQLGLDVLSRKDVKL